jgi:predicted RNA-binding Zn-ribbon protein involved in translation (DUF1610 family)
MEGWNEMDAKIKAKEQAKVDRKNSRRKTEKRYCPNCGTVEVYKNGIFSLRGLGASIFEGKNLCECPKCGLDI